MKMPGQAGAETAKTQNSRVAKGKKKTKKKQEQKWRKKKCRNRRTKRDVQVVQKLWPKSKPKANGKKYIDIYGTGCFGGRGQHWLAFGRAYDIIYGLLFVQKVCKKICCDSFIIFLFFSSSGQDERNKSFWGARRGQKRRQALSVKLKLMGQGCGRTQALAGIN